ncbi:alpha/beta hydrolase [Nocardia sp. NPDC005998]|uniref:alpha/beta fold hydrolase n=1 Tax=Nocardia sp. NPDC005998 TaxID=3156894 RepID=UPI0033A2404C
MDLLQSAVDGVRIAYTRKGSGPPVVLLHNAGATHRIWLAQIEALAAAGYTVYALDLPGYGESEKPHGIEHYTLARYTRTVHAFLKHHQLSEPALVGNCLGAAVALSLARVTAVAAVVAINPLTRLTARDGTYGPLARVIGATPARVLDTASRWHTPGWLPHAIARSAWFGDNTAARTPRSTDSVAAFPAWALTGMVHDLPNFAALETWQPTPGLRPPLCTIWGSRNRVLSATTGGRLTAAWQPEREERLPDCGHVPMLEQPDQVSAILVEFLHEHFPTVVPQGQR